MIVVAVLCGILAGLAGALWAVLAGSGPAIVLAAYTGGGVIGMGAAVVASLVCPSRWHVATRARRTDSGITAR